MYCLRDTHKKGNLCEGPASSFDRGSKAFITDICMETEENDAFRRALWTGKHLQITLMCIPPCGDIGLEIHPDVDQFLYIEEGVGVVMMGNSKTELNFRRQVGKCAGIVIPCGTWHNLVNTGKAPLKLFSVYAPPQHPKGTLHRTKAEAMEK